MSNEKNVANTKAQLSLDMPKFNNGKFELSRKKTLLDSELKSMRESFSQDDELTKLKELYNDEAFTTDEVFFENTNMKAIDFSSRTQEFNDAVNVKDLQTCNEQFCYFDPETSEFKYVFLR